MRYLKILNSILLFFSSGLRLRPILATAIASLKCPLKFFDAIYREKVHRKTPLKSLEVSKRAQRKPSSGASRHKRKTQAPLRKAQQKLV